jgi:hypothetical protein
LALITCTECGAQISDKASACPKCGAPAAFTAAAKPVAPAVTTPKPVSTSRSRPAATYEFRWGLALAVLGIVAVLYGILVLRKQPVVQAPGSSPAVAEPSPTVETPPSPDPATVAAEAAAAKAAAEAEAKGLHARQLYGYARNAESKTDMRKAVDLYEQACAAGEIDGCAMAAYWYGLAKARIPKKMARAMDLNTKACDANNGMACTNLGIDYYNGIKGHRDLAKAGELLDKGCKLGFAYGCEALKKVRWDLALDASVLWRSYHNNEVAADNQYKGRQLKIVGSISSVRKDIGDNVILDLHSPNEFMSTAAYVAGSEVNKAAVLKNGQRVLLTCTGDGMIIGRPELKSCIIEDVKAPRPRPRQDDEGETYVDYE